MKSYCQFKHIKGNSKRERETNIGKDYQTYCEPRDMRGIKYIEELHNDTHWEKRIYSKIIQCEAQKNALPNDSISFVKEELKSGDRLLMVVYSSGAGICHCIVIGWDTDTSQYFVRDPEQSKPEYKNDIFDTLPINEYILFEKVESEYLV